MYCLLCPTRLPAALHVWWAGEASALPALAFPFVKMWGSDGHGCFEALATLLLSYSGGGHGWWECFPDAPVPLLRKLLVRWAGHARQADGWGWKQQQRGRA